MDIFTGLSVEFCLQNKSRPFQNSTELYNFYNPFRTRITEHINNINILSKQEISEQDRDK